MSFTYLMGVWAVTERLPSASEGFVLVFLADRANDEGICWPSISTIARATRLNRKTVIKAVALLEELGYLSRVVQLGSQSTYRLLFPPKNTPVQFTNIPIPKAGPVPKTVQGTESSERTTTSIAPVESATPVVAPEQSYAQDPDLEPVPNLVPVPKQGRGVSQKWDEGCPKSGTGGVPNLGHKPINNLSITNQYPKKEEEPEKKKRGRKPEFCTVERPEEVTEQVWAEFLAHKKFKGDRVTPLVISRSRKQAQIAGWTLNDALEEVVVQGWKGFKAEYVAKRGKPGEPKRSKSEIPSKADVSSYAEKFKQQRARLEEGQALLELEDINEEEIPF